MRHPSGRILAWSIVLLSVAAVLAVPPAAAGTQTAPEVQDAANDQDVATTGASTVPGDPLFLAADLRAFWIDNETATAFKGHLALGAAPSPLQSGTYTVTLSNKTATVTFATVPAATYTAGGVATNASIAGTVLTFSVAKAALGAGLSGVIGISASSSVIFITDPLKVATDTAPDTGNGAPYQYHVGTSGGGGGTTGKPGDKDGDGLNDTFEKQYFGNETSNQNSTGDPDHDGCNNACEQKYGTDPTKADTDGDGASDKAEIDAGTNPRDPTSKPGGTSPSPSPSVTPSPSPSVTPSPSPTPTPTTTAPAPSASSTPCDSSKDVANCFTGGNLGYAAIAGTLMVATLAVCLVALLGRWAV